MGEWGGPSLTSRSLLFVRSSLEAFGLLGTTKKVGEATKKELCGRPQTKQKAEKDKFTGKQ